jgi:microcystin synthetase protein McyA
MQNYAAAPALEAELPFWEQMLLDEPLARLPGEGPGPNAEESVRCVRLRLSMEQTQTLLHAAPAAYRMQLPEVLLTALAQTLGGWLGSSTVVVDLEAHGREDLFAELDLSRTVGWFTALYPARLGCGHGSSPDQALKTIKEQLRKIPQHGIGFGLLRYLHPDADVRQLLSSAPPREVSFDYLGQLDQPLADSSLFRLVDGSVGPAHDLAGERPYLLEVSAAIVAGQLQVQWYYSHRCHQAATIQAIADAFQQALERLIAHCLSAEAGGYTPADFPLAGLDQPALDALLREIGRTQSG